MKTEVVEMFPYVTYLRMFKQQIVITEVLGNIMEIGSVNCPSINHSYYKLET